jgi:uncharacterized protein YggL (DUF469 family)
VNKTPKNNDFVDPDAYSEKLEKKLKEFTDLIVRVSERYSSMPDIDKLIDHLIDHVNIVAEHDYMFKLGTSDADNFLTISEIEFMMLDLTRRLKEADLKFLLSDMKNLNGETDIINKKKENTLKKE